MYFGFKSNYRHSTLSDIKATHIRFTIKSGGRILCVFGYLFSLFIFHSLDIALTMTLFFCGAHKFSQLLTNLRMVLLARSISFESFSSLIATKSLQCDAPEKRMWTSIVDESSIMRSWIETYLGWRHLETVNSDRWECPFDAMGQRIREWRTHSLRPVAVSRTTNSCETRGCSSSHSWNWNSWNRNRTWIVLQRLLWFRRSQLTLYRTHYGTFAHSNRPENLSRTVGPATPMSGTSRTQNKSDKSTAECLREIPCHPSRCFWMLQLLRWSWMNCTQPCHFDGERIERKCANRPYRCPFQTPVWQELPYKHL